MMSEDKEKIMKVKEILLDCFGCNDRLAYIIADYIVEEIGGDE